MPKTFAIESVSSAQGRTIAGRSGRHWNAGFLWLFSCIIAASLSAAVISTRGIARETKATNVAPIVAPATRPIESIRVGQAVLTSHQTGDGDFGFGSEVDLDSWKHIFLRARKRDGSYCHIELLRPVTWIEENQTSPSQLLLEIPECGISGIVEIVSIGACPKVEPLCPGYQTVTGTYRHDSSEVLRLTLTNSEVLRVTSNHRIWSEQRRDFVSAGELLIGEQLKPSVGSAFVSSIEAETGTKCVFNLEVLVEHTFHVTQAGVLVHNSTADCAAQLKKGLPLTSDQKGTLREEARAIMGPRFPDLTSWQDADASVHHRIPLEWSHLFPNANPNRTENLAALQNDVHSLVTNEWNEFRKSLNGRVPTAEEVLQKAREIDAKYGSHYYIVPGKTDR